ncbi:class I SAM-dependent methyltransferase [bacterium D16-54]|nr:class I SAM-dependent methyltransferase [bacterium D16-54]RKJ14069.1 class I SAM-dependent methyltransferase [bacterium D16-56]
MEQSSEKQNEIEYWQKRAKREYGYKGEVFYTVTPVPYYYERRIIVLDSLRKVIEQYHANKICDMGCGDGEYLKKIYTEEKNYYGIDISENMIEIAKNRAYKDNMRIFYNVSTNGLQGISDFDFIYSVSLFAHISDEDMKKMFENIYKNLVRGGGYFVYVNK